MSRNVVIIGANRGIGLELAKAYLNNNDKVYAICRNSSEQLASMDAHVIDGIDVTADNYTTALSKALAGIEIDILIHNAGILRGDRFPEINLEMMREQFEVNSLGPLKTVLALQDQLKSGSKVGLVTSRVGSIDDNSSSNNYGYRTSKTALNMIGKCLSLDLKDQGIAVAGWHLGFQPWRDRPYAARVGGSLCCRRDCAACGRHRSGQ